MSISVSLSLYVYIYIYISGRLHGLAVRWQGRMRLPTLDRVCGSGGALSGLIYDKHINNIIHQYKRFYTPPPPGGASSDCNNSYAVARWRVARGQFVPVALDGRTAPTATVHNDCKTLLESGQNLLYPAPSGWWWWWWWWWRVGSVFRAPRFAACRIQPGHGPAISAWLSRGGRTLSKKGPRAVFCALSNVLHHVSTCLLR